MLTKSPLSSWLHSAVVIIICLHSGSAQSSRHLRGEATPVSGVNVYCLTVKQCQRKFQSLKLGGTFYSSSDFLTKGCYTKNNNVYFGIGGMYEEKVETTLVGDLVRVFCDDAVEADTSSTSSVKVVVNTKSPSISTATNQQHQQPSVKKVVCLTVKHCHLQWQILNNGGDFASGPFPSKGCFKKNDDIFFGTGGTYEEKLIINLPGNLTRVLCNGEKEAPVFTVFSESIPTVPTLNVTIPTSKPITTTKPSILTKQPATPIVGFLDDIVSFVDIVSSEHSTNSTSTRPTTSVTTILSPTKQGIDTKSPTTSEPTVGRSHKPSAAPSVSSQPTTSYSPTGIVWNHGSSTAVSDGVGYIKIMVPPNAEIGDTLFLFFSRTDGFIPLKIKGWNTTAQCFKSSNEQEACMDETRCRFTIKKESIEYCKEFDEGRGKDLGQAVFTHVLTQVDKDLSADGWRFWSMTLHGTNRAWAIVTAIPNVNKEKPIRGYAGVSCDKKHGSLFPSLFGKPNDVLLLSQSFDDSAKESHFLPPAGTELLGYLTKSDEAGYVFGKRIVDVGETGPFITGGTGGRRGDAPGVGATERLKHHRDCKDVSFSVMVNRSK